MRVESGTIEKIFLPALSMILFSGVAAMFSIYTEVQILETKVSINNQRIGTIFRKLDELRDGQDKIVRLILEKEK
jgi:hypothetical protein